MYVTVRAKGYLVENKYFSDFNEAEDFVTHKTEEAKKNKWAVSYVLNEKPDKRPRDSYK